ncbi:uncharacterized protein LOC115736759 isoform X2 [Rhodamnia argentea]|uniref:Uncharacterized protein LOC115736759 isoform X2 n=1 Tax=Rhodamnia argentea TaxID=178133 RepID=A0ABM3HU58_9MYRT|nr:uncharacterized protein LOC115736759 isoform X2 [Rhodamnia argentea]
MKEALAVALMLLAALIPSASSSPTTGPAFLWSRHYERLSTDGIKELVNYQTISPKTLAKSILSKGGWSDFLCLGKKSQQPVDVALVFLGRETLNFGILHMMHIVFPSIGHKVQSLDISANNHVDPALVDLLKVSFTRSNFSMAFPYVAAIEEETVETSLISGFTETCGQDLETSSIALLGSCSLQGDNYHKLSDLQSLNDYLASRKEKRPEGKADLVMFCHEASGLSPESEVLPSESEIFSELLLSMERSGQKFASLYVSRPYSSVQYPSLREVERFLAEGSAGNASPNSTCEGVCQIKSSLIEGLFVGLVLLVILISGLSCMMGIQTPTRFEVPQES